MGGPWNPELHIKMFWDRVDQTPSCWLWTGKKHKRGYGELMVNRKVWRAHRFSYYLSTGQTPEVVRHTCDTPLCVRPSHLLPGTQQDNVRDRDDRNRRQNFRGVNNANAKFTEDQVTEIRNLYATGQWRQVELAAKYNVSQAAISRVTRRATFKQEKNEYLRQRPSRSRRPLIRRHAQGQGS